MRAPHSSATPANRNEVVREVKQNNGRSLPCFWTFTVFVNNLLVSAQTQHILYLSRTHREALTALLYGLKSDRGFIALIAGPGMGKTTSSVSTHGRTTRFCAHGVPIPDPV